MPGTRRKGYASQRREALYRLGRCADCGQPRSPEAGRPPFKMTCEKCRKARLARTRAMRARRREAGLCAYCGRRPPEAGTIRCPTCARSSSRQRKRTRRARLRKGLCPDCGLERGGSERFKACDWCRRKDAARMRLAKQRAVSPGNPPAGPPGQQAARHPPPRT